MSIKKKIRNRFLGILALFILAGLLSYPKVLSFYPPAKDYLESFKINLGLDLQGGIHLEYRADVSDVEAGKVDEALQAAQDVVERRVNAFGVGEPLVQTAKSGEENRIVVELPGVKNVEEAKKRIGEAPSLEFRETTDSVDPEIQKLFDSLNEQNKKKAEDVLPRALKGEDFGSLAKEFSQDPGSRDEGGDLGFVSKGQFVPEFDSVLFDGNLKNGEVYPKLVESQFGWHIIKFIESRGEGDEKEVHGQHILFAKQNPLDNPQFQYKSTGLTGKNLESVQVVFQQQGIGEPQISLKFNEEGTQLFADITKRNVGKPLAIFLDGELKTAPVIQTEILNGEAVITGNFTIEEANSLQRMINEGALPVPLELVSQQSIEASLGADSLQKSFKAGIAGMIAVMVFMILYYRLPGLIASVGILIYVTVMVSVFKLSGILTPWPITLSLSGIAGFILTIGMAVDANVLIFERMKEELHDGKSLPRALEEGFRRAWPSIKDGNLSTILTSLILIWFGTSFVKGFALILVIGVLMSMFTAVVIVKIMMKFLLGDWAEKRMWLIIPIRSENKENDQL